MNFFDALNAHLAWKQRLHDYVEGNTSEYLDTDVVVLEESCDLGKWLRENHEAMRQVPEYLKLREVHADFHRCLAEVAGLANRGNIPSAEAALHGEFAHVAALLVKAISRFAKVTGSSAAAA